MSPVIGSSRTLFLILGAIFTFICMLGESQGRMTIRVETWIDALNSTLPLFSVKRVTDIQTYIKKSLNSSIQTSDALLARTSYESDPNWMLPLYYYTGSGMDYLIGVPEVTEIPIPDTFEACGRTALFEKLNMTCMPAYTVQTPGRTVPGQLSTYSLADGWSSLVYELDKFEASPEARTTVIEFNVFDRLDGNIAIARIMLERSSYGNIVASRSVVTVPQHFVYLGGNASALEWLLVVGHAIILLVSLASIVYITVQCVRHRSTSFIGIVVFATAVLCIVSGSLQLSSAAFMPLMNVNLGTAKSVQLSETAASFNTVNGLNAVIVLILSVLLLEPGSKIYAVPVFASLVSMVVFAFAISVQFGNLWSFGQSFMLLTRIGLRRVTGAEFDTMTATGFSLIAILVFHSLILYVITGLIIASFLPQPRLETSRSPGPPPLAGRKRGEDERPQSPLIEPRSPLSGDVLEPRSPLSGDVPEQNLVASVEVLAGRALSQISQLKERMASELETARKQLERAQDTVRGLRHFLDPQKPSSDFDFSPPTASQPVSGQATVHVGYVGQALTVPTSSRAQAGPMYPPLSPVQSDNYPHYVEPNADGTFLCMWCDSKTLASADQLAAHLQGKEHTKRCANSSISPYGSVGHDKEVAEYIALYGHDPYARLRHWPACIEEHDVYWSCAVCGGKKFQTQRAVNEHLLDTAHADRAAAASHTVPAAKPSTANQGHWDKVESRTTSWPSCIVDEGEFWSCTVCLKKFNSEAIVNDHLVHPRHVQRLAYGDGPEPVTSPYSSVTGSKGSPYSSVTGSQSVKASRAAERECAIKEEAETKQRLERLARFIDFDRKECRLCQLKFASLRDTESHIDDLVHVAHNYEFSIDNIA